MKAVMVMFDTLCRRFLPPYGNDVVHAPNFSRLAERTVTFDNAYIGSMPCMPARRELHTGRYNFLHRSWGPMEPFDTSMPERLKHAGVHTHLASDHYHYWEDGGATYHTRYSTWEFFRGQEGDPWKAVVNPPEPPPHVGNFGRTGHRGELFRQDQVNRSFIQWEHEQPQSKTFRAGLEFLDRNYAEDNWFLQIETFDPHEPHYVMNHFKRLYDDDYDGPQFDWPFPRRVEESDEEVHHARTNYSALVSMCDRYLGRVLDAFDEYGLWDDTMLIVTTDHGYMLSEHDWWGKNVMPFYSEVARIPWFMWDPRSRRAGERSNALTQFIDLAPTLYSYFNVEPAPHMQGQDLTPVLSGTTDTNHDAVLFGTHGGHVCVTDGRFVYMRGPASESNEPLYQYTVMPTHMNKLFSIDGLKQAELADPFPFTQGVRPLKMPERSQFTGAFADLTTMLFDLREDPKQTQPIEDQQVERRMIELLRRLMAESEAPVEQYERLGLDR